MAVAVSRDLTVQVLEDVNAVKLADRQQALKAAIQKGEPKSLGVSQVMLGLMVMSYSIPLHCIPQTTEVVNLGVPWWSGLVFITAGVVALILDKKCSLKILQLCLMVSALSLVVSVVAVIIYSVDMNKHPEVPCTIDSHAHSCSEQHYVSKLSKGLKSSLLLFTLAQLVISSIICFLLFRQRRNFGLYTSLTDATQRDSYAVITPPTAPDN
ncbi:transmembrane protein 176 [Pholidichthys leucotaenia]